ncbi:MAG: hypothetical protein U1E36_06875 [Rickettsiales bacterium]
MKWEAEIYHPQKLRFIIDYDEYVGYYLYVWEGEKNTFDYLQDTLDIAKRQALEDFGVPLNVWKQVE